MRQKIHVCHTLSIICGKSSAFYRMLSFVRACRRVASMQDGAAREDRASIMRENMRNLRQVWQTSRLVLLDNESGLLDSYALMYRGGADTGAQFIQFHLRMLHSICVFR